MLLGYLLVAIGFGAALTLLLRGIFAPAPKLKDLADGTYRARSAAQSAAGGRIRVALLEAFPDSKLIPPSLHADLRLTRTVEEAHVMAKLTSAVVAGGIALAAGVGFTAVGLPVPLLMLPPAAALFAAGGFFLPDMSVRSQAAERREEFVSAFASYLDLTRILMGASDGPESALEKAAAGGRGWVFGEIRRALDLARSDQSLKHWDALAMLGRELDIIELREFADSMSATATSQALPDTLAARADAMRTKALRAIEGEAESKTEQMDIPLTLLTMASMVFVMYAGISMSSGGGGFGIS